MLNVASGSSLARQQAAIRASLTGRGRPRSRAWAWISPQTVAAWKLHGRTTILAKKARRPTRRCDPPAVQVCPLGQLADRDECGRELPSCESVGEGVGQLPLEDRGGDVGVDDDVAHARRARRDA